MPLIEPKLLHTVVEKYEGQSKDNGLPHGHGTAYLRAGHKYTGSFFMGYMHGRGRYEWNDGLVYEGDMSWGTINGSGSFSWPTGAVYTGDVVDGLCHGVGQQQLKDGMVVYDGQWQHGVRHGHGMIMFMGPNGLHYSGQWDQDAKSGTGVMVYASGNWYEGEWKNDEKCGEGTMTWATRAEQYVGEWEGDLPQGRGEYVWWLRLPRTKIRPSQVQQCNRYIGEFSAGQRHGYGRFYYANGAYYEGLWEQNLRQGRGVFVFEDGTVVSSVWEGGKPQMAINEVRPKSSDPKVAIDDLVHDNPGETPSQLLKSIGAVLLRFMSELRHMYNHYSALPIPGLIEAEHLGFPAEGVEHEGEESFNPGGGFTPKHPNPGDPLEAIWHSGRPSFKLLMCQLHKMLRDCSIPTRLVPTSFIDMLAAKTHRDAPAILELRRELGAEGWDVPENEDHFSDPHNPVKELDFRRFCELVVRIAAVRNQHMPSLERRVHALISQNIVPTLEAIQRGDLLGAPSPLDGDEAREAAIALDDHLYDCFQHVRSDEYSQLPASRPPTAAGAPGHNDAVLGVPGARVGVPVGPVGGKVKELPAHGASHPEGGVTVRQLVLLLVRRGLVKGTPQYRAPPPPPSEPEGEESGLELEKQDSKADPKKKVAAESSTDKSSVSQRPSELAEEEGEPGPSGPIFIQNIGVSLATVVQCCMLACCPGDAQHAVRVSENGTLQEDVEELDSVPFQDLLSCEVEMLYGEFVEVVAMLADRAIPEERMGVPEKLRSFVLGGLLGWEEQGAEYPPFLLPTPENTEGGEADEGSEFDSGDESGISGGSEESDGDMSHDSALD